MRLPRFSNTFLIIIFLVVSLGLAEQKGWLERLFPEKTPQFLKDDKSPAPVVTPPQEVLSLQNSFARVAELIKPSVVNISAIHVSKAEGGSDPHEFFYGDPNDFFEKFFGRPQRRNPSREFRTEGTGSGVIIDPEGYIVTNHHVVQKADQLTVTLSDGASYKGKVVGSDSRTDLAVVKIKSSNPFPYAALGDSLQIRIGDWVLAIGSPFGLEQTVTAGIISAIRQSLNIEGKWFRDLIQTDAAINRGNSGGPLVNIKGEVVGINVAIFAPTGVFSGVGFAVPVNQVKTILKELIEKGYVERSWMGVEIVEINDVIANQLGLDTKEGALINKVVPDSPAGKTNLQRGDVIVEFGGKKVKDVPSLQDMVAKTPPKKKIQVKIIRNNSEKTVNLVTESMPGSMAKGEELPEEGSKDQDIAKPKTMEWLGAKFANLGGQVSEQYSIPEDIKKGVVAIDVPANSAAAEAGLMEGDMIASVNRKEVSDTAALAKYKADFDLKKGLFFDVYRRGHWLYFSYKSLQ